MDLYSVLLLVAGVVSAGLGARATFGRDFAARYAESSPKAWLWRKAFGIERATMLMHRVFGPIGIAVGIGIVVFVVRLWMREA